MKKQSQVSKDDSPAPSIKQTAFRVGVFLALLVALVLGMKTGLIPAICKIPIDYIVNSMKAETARQQSQNK